MNENVKIIFGLVGGLAMFLYGMNSMSDALQKAAGEKMKKVPSFLTKNPLMGALAGALVTAVLQSSSATTVMVIGFVSAGLMTLPQAISVIFGANIGTTMTAQLMAFKISNYIYPIIFVGFILYFVSKKEKVKNIGMVIFSFGLLFEGIEIMGGVMKPLAGSHVFTDLMGKVSEIPVLGIVLGAVMTVVVQSSSATIAVLQNFASQAVPGGTDSVIGLAGAIPILLGDNIGTTITALLASIGQSKNARRTAVAHSVFNISGSILFAFLIRIKFSLKDGEDINNYKFTVDGKIVSPVKSGSDYIVSVNKVSPDNYDKMYLFKAESKNDPLNYASVKYSCFTYIKSIMENDFESKLTNTMKAMYFYNREIEKYISKTEEV